MLYSRTNNRLLNTRTHTHTPNLGQRELTVRLSLPRIGLSLVGADEEEGRREIGFLCIEDIRVEYLQGTREVCVEYI